MKPKPFLGALAKVERTETQIDDLNTKIAAFLNTSPYERVSELDKDGTIEVWRFQLTGQLPADITVIAGEILHNLRSSLDNLAAAVALQHSGTTKDTNFPFGAGAKTFEDQVVAKTIKLPPDARTMIRALKAYPGGNDLLWALHFLNRDDKHPSMDPAIINLSGTMQGLIVTYGVVLTVGPRNGRHFVRDKENNLSQPANDLQPRYQVLDGEPVVFFETSGAPQNEMEFLTALPGTQFQTDFEPSLSIVFDEIKGFEREPVVAVLNQMRDAVQGILEAFDAHFFR